MSAVYVSSTEAPTRPSAGRPLKVAGLCLIGLVLTWVVAALLPAGKFKDAVALHHFTVLRHTDARTLANSVLLLLKPPLFIVWSAAVILVALVRAHRRVALAVALVMALAPLSAEVLKPLLAHPHMRVGRITVGPASWPSGHASAALALVLCAVLVAPKHKRAITAALGAAFVVAVGISLLILAWHMPSDVLGGYLIAALWTALAVAALRVAERRWPSARGASRSGASPARARTMRTGVP